MKLVSTERDRTIPIVAMSCVFSGPPRAGKTTVVKRLKGQDVDITEITASTGVVDEKGVVRIDFIPSSNVVTDQEWVEMEEDDEVQAFLNLTIIPQQTESDKDLDPTNEDSETPQRSHMDKSPQTTPSPNTKAPVEAPSQSVEASPLTVGAPSQSIEVSPLTIEPPSQSVEASPLTIEAPTQSVEAPSQNVEASLSTVEAPSISVKAPAQSVETPSLRVKAPILTDEPPSWRVDTPLATVETQSKITQDGGHTRDTHCESKDMVELSPKSVLERAQRQSQQIRAARRLCKRHFLHLSDTGGQPEFRKMIALLIPRQSITFIVSDMRHKFDSRYPVRFCHHTNDDEIEYSSFSIKDTINDIIEHNTICSKSHSEVEESIMFIGTHKDLIPIEKREEIIMRRNKELLQILEQCPHYHPDMVIRSDEMNIIFCVDNSTFEIEHRCIRSSVMRICESERFQVKVKPELLLLALTLKGAKVTVLPLDKCVEVAMDCGIAEEDVRESLSLLHEKLMMIRVYELNEDETIVVVKPKALINKVSSLLKYMITRDEQVYSSPVVSYIKLKEIAADGESVEVDVLIKIFIHLLIIAPIQKSVNEAVKEFLVPSMFPDSMPTKTESRMCTVPSIFSESSPRVRTEPNQVLFAIKPMTFSVPSTLHAPVLCSLLQDTRWSIQNIVRDVSKTCIVISKTMRNTAESVTFKVTLFKESVSLCLGQDWKKSNVSKELLQQCFNADKALTSALRQSLKLFGYGHHDVSKYCFSCFEQAISSTVIQGDCSTSHTTKQTYPENIWFSRVGFLLHLDVFLRLLPSYSADKFLVVRLVFCMIRIQLLFIIT